MPPEMLEATRLTRAGRPAEATALLQRMLRGDARSPGAGRGGSRTIDAQPLIAAGADATLGAPSS
ncbi:MAG TPA: hypothetical protein VFY19_07025, partial [Geminicoccaceae bacterium]|nr:hypothetical protein [Geminicoccaceae bacterium]